MPAFRTVGYINVYACTCSCNFSLHPSRSDTWAGVSQYPNLPPNTNYYFTAHFKALNQNDNWMRVTLMAAVDYGQYQAGEYDVPLKQRINRIYANGKGVNDETP